MKQNDRQGEKLLQAAKYALQALKNAGADKARVSAAAGRTEEFNIDGGEFSLMRTIFDEAIGLTAYIGGRKGVAATNTLDRDGIDTAVGDCIAAARSGVPDKAWDISPFTEKRHFSDGCIECDRDGLFNRTEELRRNIAEQFPTIMIEQLITSHRYAQSVFVNSNGVEFSADTGCYEADVMFSAHEGEKASSFFGSGFRCVGLDKPFIECSSLRSDLEDVSKQVDTLPFEGKFEGVALLTPATFSEFLGMAFGNFAGDGVIIEGTSPWKDSLGKSVASAKLSVEIAPVSDDIVCGERITSDGFVSENYYIIRDGVLESFMLSQYASNKTGFPRAKNSSGSVVVPAGDKTLSELIAGIDKGILVGRFSGGDPGTNGDFSGVAKNSFLIENGRITSAVSETMINGNIAAMLTDLVGLSSERVSDGGMLLPYAAFGGVTVSGK